MARNVHTNYQAKNKAAEKAVAEERGEMGAGEAGSGESEHGFDGQPPAPMPAQPNVAHSAEYEPSADAPTTVEQFVLMRDCKVMYDGCLTLLKEGKVVSASTHDLDLLRRQGAKLLPVTLPVQEG